MASQKVKSAFTEKMRTQERGSYPAKGAKVKAAMTPPKYARFQRRSIVEELPQKQTKRVKNTRISGR